MRRSSLFSASRLPAIVLACILAGCSTNGGFGTPATGPQPVNNYPEQPGGGGVVAPAPNGAPNGGFGNNGMPAVAGSPAPTPTPVPNTLSIVGAAMRLAYDGSAQDPVKAQRLLELSFALQNTTQNQAKITTVSARAEATAFPQAAVSVTAPANQISPVAWLVLKTPGDPSKYRSLTISFLDGQKMIASSKLDMPVEDATFTALDDKHPRGPLSIDGAEVSPISAGQGTWFECTFAITNPSTLAAAITEFDIKPPKGAPIRLPIPLVVPLRSASGFISVVVPYSGKTLPPGDYLITAQQGASVLASTSAVLL
jgi:hypothetical protein